MKKCPKCENTEIRKDTGRMEGQKPEVPCNLREDTSWHKTGWVGAEVQRGHDMSLRRGGEKRVKECRTCPRCGTVLESRFSPGEGWYLWCKKCEERYKE